MSCLARSTRATTFTEMRTGAWRYTPTRAWHLALLVVACTLGCGGKIESPPPSPPDAETGCSGFIFRDQRCDHGVCTEVGDGKCYRACRNSDDCPTHDYGYSVCMPLSLYEGRAVAVCGRAYVCSEELPCCGGIPGPPVCPTK